MKFDFPAPNYIPTRWMIQRSLAIIYFLGFLIFLNQGHGLIGSQGLLPAKLYIDRVSFWQSPSLFFLNVSDAALSAVAVFGLILSLLAVAAVTDRFSTWISAFCWFTLWFLYLSIVNIGQTFYGFGWETLLLETGFLAIFFGSTGAKPSMIPIWLLRWLLFRLMFGAGLIKIRGDECWRDLTCLLYHYETQPSPNLLSWYFHNLPAWVHKLGVIFNHFVELLIPFAYFGPRRIRHVAGILTIAFQATLIFSGNLSWLNCLTIVIAFACFDDSFWKWKLPSPKKTGVLKYVSIALGVLVLALSIRPVWNLISPNQRMNASFEPFHIVNTYGAFGSVTKERMEVVLEGTDDDPRLSTAVWKEYGFKGKVGDPDRTPPQITPYHYKLDWQMWFAPMSSYQYHPWIVSLIGRLLQGKPEVLGLIRVNPFLDRPPRAIRARLYRYRFTPPGTGSWWVREFVAEYLPPLSLTDENFVLVLKKNGWW